MSREESVIQNERTMMPNGGLGVLIGLFGTDIVIMKSESEL